MKKLKNLFLITLFGLTIVSCSTENDAVSDSSANTTLKAKASYEELDEIASELTYDKNFITFVDSYLNQSVKISENLIKKYESKDEKEKEALDKENLEMSTDLATYFSMWIVVDEKVQGLSEDEIKYVVEKTLSDAVASLDKKEKLTTTGAQEMTLQSVLNGYDAPRTQLIKTYPKYTVSGITLTEALGCVVGAVAGYVYDNFKLAKNLIGVLKGESITFETAKLAVQLFFPEAKLGGAVLALATCLVWSFIF